MVVRPTDDTHPLPPPGGSSAAGPDSGATGGAGTGADDRVAARAALHGLLADMIRTAVLDEAGRRELREDLARRHRAGRLAFAAQATAAATPPPPALAAMPHPGAAAGTARYRATQAAVTAGHGHPDAGPARLSQPDGSDADLS